MFRIIVSFFAPHCLEKKCHKVKTREKEKTFNWVIIYRGWGEERPGIALSFMFPCSAVIAAFLLFSVYLVPRPDALLLAPPTHKQ